MSTTDERVELRTWSGCPSHDDAVALLERALAESGREADGYTVTWVETDDLAASLGFVGSPTFAVDGADLFAAEGAAAALTCRVYQRADGRFRPLPDAEDLTARMVDALDRPVVSTSSTDKRGSVERVETTAPTKATGGETP